MRKRHIKSVAHWTIMSLLLLFPVLMVGISAFANDEQSVNVTDEYQYETNEVNTVSDIKSNHIYKLNGEDIDAQYISLCDFQATLILNDSSEFILNTNNPDLTIEDYDDGYLYNYWDFNCYHDQYVTFYNSVRYNYDLQTLDPIFSAYNCYIYFTDTPSIHSYFLGCLSLSDWLGEKTTTVDIQNASYKQEVNNWANGFKNLPVNQWYGSLLDTIGIGNTSNSVMNVIYVYPLYVLWVYILDLIVDCLLLIINFGHDALHRLGADNE